MSAAPVDADASAWLERAAHEHTHRPALDGAGGTVTFSLLAERVAATARWLEASGIGAGDVVGVLSENAAAWPCWLHALAVRRATLLALNLRATADELVFQLRDAGASLCVAGPGADVPRLEALERACKGLRVVRVDASGEVQGDASQVAAVDAGPGAARADSAAPPTPRPLRSGPLAVLYTSGTTGRPKGVALSAEAFAASAHASQVSAPLRAGDRWLACMPLFHVGGLSILVRTALAGATAVIHPRFDEHAVAGAIARERISHVSLVASMLARVLDAWGEAPCPVSLRCVLLGGGPAPDVLIERAWRLGWPVSPTYGLTEACSQVATRAAGDRARPLAGRLRALPGLEVCVRDAAGERRRAGAEGEIEVRGASVAGGYVGHAAALSTVDAEGWLATGDIGRLDAEGLLEVLDRRDDLIVSGGENVYPAEVESVLLEHAAVLEAAVVARPDARFGARPVAYWVRRDSHGEVSASSLAEHVRSRLAGYKVPVEFIEVGALPRTASGKLQRGRVRALDEARETRG